MPAFWRRPISVASRVASKLVLLSLCSLALVHFLGIIPNPRRTEIRRKAIISESLAITSSLLAQHRQDGILRKNLEAILRRHPDAQSACIRRQDGQVLHRVGDHERHWKLPPGASSTPENIFVPVYSGKQLWGSVELTFPPHRGILSLLWNYPLVVVGLVTMAVNALVFRWYLLRAFQYLDPTKSVPMHVRATLNTFSEGVVVLDKQQRIVLANDKFKKHTGKSDDQLLGQNIDDFPWEDEPDAGTRSGSRWETPDRHSDNMRLRLAVGDEHRTYLVNTSAILGNDGERRGTIASFDDITPLEQKREELSSMLTKLQSSRDELKQRNKELQYLATRDPLTGCLNRRTFFELFDQQWKSAERDDTPLSCFMVDVDHFKSVNDNYGHSMGDEVLRCVAKTLLEIARASDVVCRYGGEEFCVLLPQTDAAQACQAAERMRLAIQALEFEQLSVTASLGVSARAFGAGDPQELLDQADKCLYVAKRGGRNQVVRWDDAQESIDQAEEQAPAADRDDRDATPDRRKPRDEQDGVIPYPAVASLLSALAYRDSDTAAHSVRVAELCVATAAGLLSVKQTYVLEMAALLHDIGKIGVPDAILLKPGPLTREEWETMELHDRIGVEIVQASFSNQMMVDVVRFHHATYGGSPDAPHLPRGDEIPIGARIVAICDAYDAMVSDRVYRKGRSPAEAFAELRRCADRQFDPQLVERFIEIVQQHQSLEVPVKSRQVALQVGMQIERLAEAIDDRDSASIKALASRLEATAARGGIEPIQTVAAELKETAEADDDGVSLMKQVEQLLSLCRSAQRIYVETDVKRPPRKPVAAATNA